MKIDWRRTGKEIWKMVYEYLDFFEKQIIWKYFGLVKPVLPIVDMGKINREVHAFKEDIYRDRDMIVMKNTIRYESECEHGPCRLMIGGGDFQTDFELNSEVDRFRDFVIRTSLNGREKWYISLPVKERDVRNILAKYNDKKFSLQCPRCKNYNVVGLYHDESFIAPVFKCLKEAFPQRCSIIYKHYLCSCRVIKWSNVEIVVEPYDLFHIMLQDFYKL